MNYFSQNTLFFILQLCLAPFFNFSPLSDLKYNLPQISGKIGFFQENIGFFRFFAEKSAIFPDFLSIFLQTIFPSKNLFQHQQKPIFHRKIGRKNRFFFSLGIGEATGDLRRSFFVSYFCRGARHPETTDRSNNYTKLQPNFG